MVDLRGHVCLSDGHPGICSRMNSNIWSKKRTGSYQGSAIPERRDTLGSMISWCGLLESFNRGQRI